MFYPVFPDWGTLLLGAFVCVLAKIFGKPVKKWLDKCYYEKLLRKLSRLEKDNYSYMEREYTRALSAINRDFPECGDNSKSGERERLLNNVNFEYEAFQDMLKREYGLMRNNLEMAFLNGSIMQTNIIKADIKFYL